MSKVVSFARSADYLHQHALTNRRQANMLDALELMRRALEREPGNPEFQMDLAEMLCEIGCHQQSSQLLLAILSGPDAPGECYFGLCCNFLGQRDMKAAYSAMLRFLALEPEAVERAEVGETLAELLQDHLIDFTRNRRQRRAAALAGSAQLQLRAGALMDGMRLLSRSLQLDPVAEQPRALLALCLMLQGDLKRALRQAELALKREDPEVKTRCIAAQVFARAGEEKRALRQLDVLRAARLEDDEQRMLIHTASELGMDALASELSSAALRQMPYDVFLLHTKAVAIVNLGRPPEDAAKYWNRILRIDPQDAVASCYQQLCERGLPQGTRLSYAYVVTDEEGAKRDQLIREAAQTPRLAEESGQQKKLKAALRWAVGAPGQAPLPETVALLGAMKSKEAELLLRSLLIRPDVPQLCKLDVLTSLIERDARRPYLTLGEDGQLRDGLSTEPADRRLSPGERRVLRRVARAQQSRDHRSAGLVEALFYSYLDAGGQLPPHVNASAWAAALVCLRLKLSDNPQALKLLVSVFGCSERAIHHVSRQIEHVLRKELPDETD